MNEVQGQQIDINQVQVGMCVTSLDRPWLETPFILQGFVVKSEEEIKLLKQYCNYVYIEVEQGQAFHAPQKRPVPYQPPTPQVLTKKVSAKDKSLHRGNVYPVTESVEKELAPAKQAHDEVHALIDDIMGDVQSGQSLQLPIIREAVTPMIDSILRNPDAFVWLMTLKSKDAYTYTHSLNAAVLAVNMGRQLGFSKDDLQELAMGALLFDVGKIKLPSELLNKPMRYSPVELKVVKRHVQFGLEVLNDAKGVTRNVLAMVEHHHERHNGHGYPIHLKGTEIPVFGRIAALVDCFDAITTKRVYAPAMSPYHAALKLYEWRGVDFQPELVEQFIQAIGIYPTGTLVELSTGEVGVILSQNNTRRLRPKVMLVLDCDKQPLGNYPILNLATELHDKDGDPLEISHPLEPGAYGIDPQEFYI